MGADVGSLRTPEQTDLAYFWSENFFAQWNRALRAIATAHLDKIGDSARLFALANLASADAAITCWDSKLYYAFWRPVTAIAQGDNDGNTRTQGNTSWHPLINTPNYPDYTSGANNITGAMTRSLRAVLRDGRVHLRRHEQQPLCRSEVAHVPAVSQTRPGTWSRPASFWASTSVSPTPWRESRASRWPSGPSGTSCGRSTIAAITTTTMATRMTSDLRAAQPTRRHEQRRAADGRTPAAAVGRMAIGAGRSSRRLESPFPAAGRRHRRRRARPRERGRSRSSSGRSRARARPARDDLPLGHLEKRRADAEADRPFDAGLRGEIRRALEGLQKLRTAVRIARVVQGVGAQEDVRSAESGSAQASACARKSVLRAGT